MTGVRTWTFSCDSALGCFAHATVAAEALSDARRTLAEVLHWRAEGDADLCPEHAIRKAALS